MTASSTAVETAASAVQQALAAVRNAINAPADQIRLLSGLAAFAYTALPGDVTGPCAAFLAQRAALSQLALAISDWTPPSSTEALVVLSTVKPLFDNAIIAAADRGDTGSYEQLRRLRARVIADLQARGAALPPLIAITLPSVEPSLVVAWQLYADAGRSVELLARNNQVIHPAFFPRQFEALAY